VTSENLSNTVAPPVAFLSIFFLDAMKNSLKNSEKIQWWGSCGGRFLFRNEKPDRTKEQLSPLLEIENMHVQLL
jgi:hypothetical protein